MEEDRGSPPEFVPQTRQKSGCFRAGAITCAILALGFVLLVVVGIVMLARNPNTKNLVSNAQVMATCQQRLTMIGQALKRYEIRHDQYPDHLTDLCPDFLPNKTILTCPADTRDAKTAAADSYTYVKPAPGAPDDTPVVMCNRHVLIPRMPPATLVLRKDGKVVASPPGPVRTPPATSPMRRN